ncbi:MAG: hypothetical protein Q8Q01_03495 [archaeon]|nr:hypothetical protein [archaeon]
MKDKKGITPIMATVLLLSFAVAIGVVVMNFGRAQVEESAECPVDIGLKLAEISGQKQLCYNAGSKQVKFTIENGVNTEVKGIIVNIIGAQEAKSFDIPSASMIKLGNYLGNVNYDSGISGDIKQVKITPKVVLYDQEQICVEQALVVENLKGC